VSVSERGSRQVRELWSEREPDIARNYFGFPALRPYLISTAFGHEMAQKHADNRWWSEDIVADCYLRDHDVKSILSLCCGFGAVEQHMVSYLGSASSCVGIDVASGAVGEASRRAAAAGLDAVIRYEVADINCMRWPDETYDLVIANGALHHLSQLDSVLDGVKRSLKPGGLLYANEHIGAQYQEYPSRQAELINAVAYLVPPDLRCRHPRRPNPFSHRSLRMACDLLLGNEVVGRGASTSERATWKRLLARAARAVALRPRQSFGPLVVPQRRYLLGVDPSEGVSSDRIVDAIRRRFGQVHLHPYGGAVLAYALDRGFYDGFDEGNATHVALLEELCRLEAHYVEVGELPHEHAVIVASRGA
jgi:SAM-dependent methyltransferase